MDIDPQLKQKLIEEENKRKKAIIEQALLDRLVWLYSSSDLPYDIMTNNYYIPCRAHQQQVETQKLRSVKLGLSELEKIVSKDVKILRDKIEETDRLYNSAK